MNSPLLSLLPVSLALLAGAMLPFQVAANASLGRVLGHPLWATLVSLCVSLAVVVPALLVWRVPLPALSGLALGPWWLWVGGVLGALYVAAAATLAPQLGAGGFLVCVVAGQMVAALLVDYFGLMGLPARPIPMLRLAGVALILLGVWLAQMPGKAPLPSAPEAAAQQ